MMEYDIWTLFLLLSFHHFLLIIEVTYPPCGIRWMTCETNSLGLFPGPDRQLGDQHDGLVKCDSKIVSGMTTSLISYKSVCQGTGLNFLSYSISIQLRRDYTQQNTFYMIPCAWTLMMTLEKKAIPCNLPYKHTVLCLMTQNLSELCHRLESQQSYYSNCSFV